MIAMVRITVFSLPCCLPLTNESELAPNPIPSSFADWQLGERKREKTLGTRRDKGATRKQLHKGSEAGNAPPPAIRKWRRVPILSTSIGPTYRSKEITVPSALYHRLMAAFRSSTIQAALGRRTEEGIQSTNNNRQQRRRRNGQKMVIDTSASGG